MKRTDGRAIPSAAASNIPRRKNTNVLGTMTKFQRGRDDKKRKEIDEHDQSCMWQWRNREASGKGSMLADMQKQVYKRKMDDVFVNPFLHQVAKRSPFALFYITRLLEVHF